MAYNYQYWVHANYVDASAIKSYSAVTLKMSRFKLKRYIRYLMKYKHPDHKLNFITYFRSDENGKMLPNQIIKVAKSYKDVR